jgi:hypothetical protein
MCVSTPCQDRAGPSLCSHLQQILRDSKDVSCRDEQKMKGNVECCRPWGKGANGAEGGGRRACVEVSGERLLYHAMAFLLPRAGATTKYFAYRIVQFLARVIFFTLHPILHRLLERKKTRQEC